MQNIQDSVFSIVKTTNLSPAVFNFLQPSDDFKDKTPLGGILKDTKHGWLALGPKFCVVDLRNGLKVAARTFGATLSNNTFVTCVVELPKPLTENSQQLIISLQCDDIGMICVLHINGSQILRCMQTDVVVTELAVCDRIPDGPFTCFDGLVMAGTKSGEIFVFDLNKAGLIQALKDISQGYEHLVQNEANPSSLSFLPLNAIQRIEEQRELAIENGHHLAVLINENSMVEGQYIFRNPDGTVRMKAKRDHIRVTVLQYIPQLGSMAVGFNFGAFQIWNLLTLDLEFTSQVNIECLPVTHFAFQEPCDDPRAFCYLWVVFSVIDRYEEEEFPLAVMYSLTYQGKRMLSDTKCLYQDFSTAAIRFQLELGAMEEAPLLGGKCISCHSYSIKSTLGDEGEDSMLNICQLVWECWGEDVNSPMQYGMLLFDLDQWYKDQMPATYQLQSNTFMCATWCRELAGRGAVTLHARLEPASVCPYSHATRLEEHFYPNSLQYNCIWLNTSEALSLRTVGIQRQVVAALEAAGGASLLHPARLARVAAAAGLAPHAARHVLHATEEDQRRYLLSVALEARLTRFLKRCAHDWATGTHSGVGCTLPFLVDWAWKRAIELKENAKELTAPLFVSSAMPDRNVIRCLEHCVQQLTQLTGLMDAILTKCCNLVVPDALSEMEERHVGIGCVSLYFQVVQWFLRVGLLPERGDLHRALPYPQSQLAHTYSTRRRKLNRLQENANPEESGDSKSCSLLYIDQLIEHEFGGDRIHQMWIKGGSECHGLYPPPSLYSLLRLYLLPDIAEEHKHSLVLYLLVDYSMIYDDVRYEEVIRRLMQFPTMFGLSNTAIKATQAFWHLDHRDFDFALDQLQCLTGNTLHEWQHNVVLSSLLAQKKTQAALQYLHVRKPAPVQNIKEGDVATNYSHRLNDHDKLDDWQSCCNLYLARGLVFEALDVIRMCVQNAGSINDKAQVLTFFYKGCRNTGNLSKILQVTLLPFEEEVFVKYLENCNESQTSDLLIMYYLQQARYLEAERYNNKLKLSKPQRHKEMSASVESLFEVADREGARDALVEVACGALPLVAGSVARAARECAPGEHVRAPKPMSVFVQAKSPKNTFTYKSSFIQDTIENASETWMHKPKMRKGLKRALDIEETPFICTPKLLRTRSMLTQLSESTPPKRGRLSLSTPQRPPRAPRAPPLGTQMDELLDMPEVQTPVRIYEERAETPHSILKIRRGGRDEAPSPAESAPDSDDELLETASSHTHYSDSTNKHLRFTIPTASESGSTPSPLQPAYNTRDERDRVGSEEKDAQISATVREKEMDISTDSFATTTSHAMNENHPLESPPKKLATESNVQPRKSYKDTVRARRSFSISANSSLSEDPNTSIESIADISVTLINPRYTGERKRTTVSSQEEQSQSNLSGQSIEGIVKQSNFSAQEVKKNLEQSDFSAQDVKRNLDQSDFSAQDAKRNWEQTKSSVRNVERTLDQSNLSALNVERSLGQSNFSVLDIEYKHRYPQTSVQEDTITEFEGEKRESADRLEVPRTPKGRRGIRSIGESTPLINRSRSGTPERRDSPIATPLRSSRLTRSRSRSKTPELSPRSSPLAPILEQPTQEVESEPHAKKTTLSMPRQLRSRSRTPERIDKGVSESPKLEVIKESSTKSSDSSTSSSSRRSFRSSSRTPESIDKGVSESPKLEVIKESSTKSSDSSTSSSSRRSFRSSSRTPESIDKGVSESPKLEVIKESPRKSSDSSTSSSSRRSFRSSSRTPESIDKEVSESPKLEVIKESPTTSSDSPTSSSSRRSFSSRSRTPEVEINPEPVLTTSPRSLRSRSKTPEKLMSPKKEHSARPKKSLSRIVLEANTFAKTKQTLETLETEITESRSENIIECTPMKTLKQLPSLMDVTLSPIVNKSILQSSTDSNLSEAIGKNVKGDDNASQLGLKSLPAFTTLHETYFEKSVLTSYQSSIADSSQSSREETDLDDYYKTIDPSIALIPLPPVTTINETAFNKSVLHSYESSVTETSLSIQEPVEKETTKDENLPKPFAAFASMIETDFDRSVLHSHQSSVAESFDVSKEIQNVNASSLITNDSDVEIKGGAESQDTAERKEKERIVEIEKEINDIEGDMSNDSEREGSDQTNVSTEEESVSEKESDASDTSKESSTTSSTSTTLSEDEDENEVISIEDSDIDDSDTNTDSNTNNENNVVLSEKIEGHSTDPLNQAQISLMTDDNSLVESDHSISLNYSTDTIEPADEDKEEEKPKEQEASTVIQIQIVEDISSKDEAQTDKPKPAPKSMDVVDTSASGMELKEAIEAEVAETKESKNSKSKKSALPKVTEKPTESDESEKPALRTRRRLKSTSSDKFLNWSGGLGTAKENTFNKTDIKPTASTSKEIGELKESGEPKTPITRKRANSSASLRSKEESQAAKETAKGEEIAKEYKRQESDDLKTPLSRKRTQSIASKTEEKTPEDIPTRRRARTPTSAEVRKIITRRVSREMAGKLDKSNESLDDSVSLTPKRRSARSRSKYIDDNESVASESSVVSNRSRASEDTDVKSVRKGRKSVVAAKTDLSVIPEVITEENKEESSKLIANYSDARKMTRQQKVIIETSIKPQSSSPSHGRRRVSTASLASRASFASDQDDDDPPPAFDVQPIDRISLLNKTDFEGPPDAEELQNDMSPESVASDASKMRRSRLSRAASETKTTPRAARINRRIASVDVALADTSDIGSPGPSSTDSPARGRRASFHRACEALHTPKGRRTSTDVRSPMDSPVPSESETVTPARRPRRASTLSNTSQAKSEIGKRSKNMPVLEEEDKIKK